MLTKIFDRILILKNECVWSGFIWSNILILWKLDFVQRRTFWSLFVIVSMLTTDRSYSSSTRSTIVFPNKFFSTTYPSKSIHCSFTSYTFNDVKHYFLLVHRHDPKAAKTSLYVSISVKSINWEKSHMNLLLSVEWRSLNAMMLCFVINISLSFLKHHFSLYLLFL